MRLGLKGYIGYESRVRHFGIRVNNSREKRNIFLLISAIIFNQIEKSKVVMCGER